MVQFGSTSAGAQYGSAMNVERPTLEHLKREQELMMARRTCPLSQLPYEEPVEAADGHIYERHFIEQWIAQCQAHCRPITSPLTKGELLRSLTLKPRPDLQAEVAAAMLGLGASPSSLKFEPPFFRQLDKFLERPMVQNLNLRPPAIVPIGVESAGKSTVLERIMGLTLLPRDAQMCTRMVIRVHLRRRKEEARAAVRLVLRSRRPPFAEVANTERHVAAPNFIAQYVKEMMELAVERAGQPIVTEHELLVEVHRPDAPNLDIVDVPGLVTAEKEGLQNVPALTEQLIEDVIRTERAHGIFLIVIPATEQLNTSATMKLVQKHGIEDLSIGIRTKADLKHPANSDDTRREVIEMEILGTVKDAITGAPRVAPGFVTLQQGWLAMANLSGTRVLEQVPEYHRERYRLSLMDSAEQRLWNDLIAADMNKNMPNMENTPALEARFGRFAVRAYVQRQFERFIVEHWLPKVRDGLQCFYFDTSKGYVKLGLPVPQELTADPAAPMTSALNRVVADVTEFIHGDPESIFVDEQTYAAKPETFRAIVGSRVAIAESAADSDWTGLQTDAELWRAVHGVRVAVEAAVAESDAPAVAASTAARRVAAHKTRLDKAARDVVAKLVALGRSGPLVDRFLAALDDSPVVNQTMPVYGPLPKRKLTTRLALAKRLPALGAAMRAHLLSAAVSAVENEFLPIATDVLQRAVLAAYGSATVDEPQAADRGAGRFIVRALRPEETKVLGQDLIDAFLAAVVCALGDAAAVFDVVSASGGALLVEADDVRGERLAVLTELVDVGDALRSLKQLQASVDSTLGQAQAPPPVHQRGVKVRELAKRLVTGK